MNPVLRVLGSVGIFVGISVAIAVVVDLALAASDLSGTPNRAAAIGGLSLLGAGLSTWAFLRKTARRRRPPTSIRSALADESGGSVPAPRKCPFCGETISSQASVCRWCERDLPVPQGETMTRIIPEGGLQGFLDPADDPVPAPGCWFRAGEAVTVLERHGEWARVRGRIGRAGWVKGQWQELQGYTVFRCPKCGHRTAASTRGQCAYCDQPLTYADGIG